METVKKYCYESGYEFNDTGMVFTKKNEIHTISCNFFKRMEIGSVKENYFIRGFSSTIKKEAYFNEGEECAAILHLIAVEKEFNFDAPSERKEIIHFCYQKKVGPSRRLGGGTDYETVRSQLLKIRDIPATIFNSLSRVENYWWEVNGVHQGIEYWDSEVLNRLWRVEDVLELKETAQGCVDMNGFNLKLSQFNRIVDMIKQKPVKYLIHHKDNRQFICTPRDIVLI